MDALAVVQLGVCLAGAIVLAWVAFATLRLDERCRAQEERAAVAEVEAQLRVLADRAPMEVDTPTWTLYPHGGRARGSPCQSCRPTEDQ